MRESLPQARPPCHRKLGLVTRRRAAYTRLIVAQRNDQRLFTQPLNDAKPSHTGRQSLGGCALIASPLRLGEQFVLLMLIMGSLPVERVLDACAQVVHGDGKACGCRRPGRGLGRRIQIDALPLSRWRCGLSPCSPAASPEVLVYNRRRFASKAQDHLDRGINVERRTPHSLHASHGADSSLSSTAPAADITVIGVATHGCRSREVSPPRKRCDALECSARWHGEHATSSSPYRLACMRL